MYLILQIYSKIGNEFDKVLSDVEYIFNNTCYRLIGTTPCRMLCGIDQRSTVTANVKEFVENKRISNICVNEIREKGFNKNK